VAYSALPDPLAGLLGQIGVGRGRGERKAILVSENPGYGPAAAIDSA